MKHIFIPVLIVLTASFNALADQTLSAHKVDTLPLINGIADDTQWQQAPSITTHDPIANVDITLKAIYTDDHIAILASYADESKNLGHRELHWNQEKQLYESGYQREDTLVLKWSMEFFPIDLSISAEEPYRADIWYWKSHRTDHAGYADDKHQIYSDIKIKGGHRVLSKLGHTYYLIRSGDEGQGAYKGLLPTEYKGDIVAGFILRSPSGSRADVRAKGHWENGVWTLEFSRKLDTGYSDDIQFELDQSYQFGVSRYEIAGRKEDPSIEIPLYGSGEITEHLILEFK